MGAHGICLCKPAGFHIEMILSHTHIFSCACAHLNYRSSRQETIQVEYHKAQDKSWVGGVEVTNDIGALEPNERRPCGALHSRLEYNNQCRSDTQQNSPIIIRNDVGLVWRCQRDIGLQPTDRRLKTCKLLIDARSPRNRGARVRWEMIL